LKNTLPFDSKEFEKIMKLLDENSGTICRKGRQNVKQILEYEGAQLRIFLPH